METHSLEKNLTEVYIKGKSDIGFGKEIFELEYSAKIRM